jgi:serine protease AprX
MTTMSRVSIKDELQSYEDSVDTELERSVNSWQRNRNSEEKEAIRNRLSQLELQREHLERSLLASAKTSDDTRWEKKILRKLEAFSRRLSLGLPKSGDDFLAALRWISQQGKEAKELDLIRTVKNNPPYDSGEIQELLNIAENKVSQRLVTTKYKYLIYFSSDILCFGENVVVLHRYPAFTIVEADEQTIAQLQEYYPTERLSSSDLLPPPKVKDSNMRDQKIRFSVPILDEWKKQIEAIGADVKILRPLGQYTLVVSVPDEASLERIKNLEKVEDVSLYVPDIKVQPQHFEQLGHEASEAEISQARLNATDQRNPERASYIPGLLIANFFTSSDRDQAAVSLSEREIHIVSRPGKNRLIIDLSQHPDIETALSLITKQLGLRSLEEKKLDTPLNDIARQILGEGVIPPNPHPNSNTLGLTGAGEVIAVADTGLDTGEQMTLHLDFQGRVKSIHSFPMAPSWSTRVLNPADDDGAADDHSGHGTHVAGSLVGGGEQAQGLGLSPIKGISPGAKLIFQAIEQTPQWTAQAKLGFLKSRGQIPPRILGGIPDDLADLFTHAYEQDARIHSNSWGKAVAADYDSLCDDLDTFVWEHKDFLVIVAAGNSGCQESSAYPAIRLMSLNSPGVAKNCLTVGASENGRANQFSTRYGELDAQRFPYAPFHEASLVASTDHIAAFSSRGPCKPTQQRRKPDVLAPGTFILSTRSSQLPDTNYADAPYPLARKHYMYMHGTSMATPLVAGSCALVRQYLRDHMAFSSPSAALVKAMIIHSASYLPDGREQTNLHESCPRNHPSSHRWADCEQGWGRVYLKAVLNPDPPTQVKFFDIAQGLETGNERIFEVKIEDSSVPLRVTLVYTDYPGESLINNLNLLLLSPEFNPETPNREHRYLGNDFLKQNRFDRVNNVEGVIIEHPVGGVWTIKVVASAVPEGPQDFALVVSGGGLTQ